MDSGVFCVLNLVLKNFDCFRVNYFDISGKLGGEKKEEIKLQRSSNKNLQIFIKSIEFLKKNGRLNAYKQTIGKCRGLRRCRDLFSKVAGTHLSLFHVYEA